MHNKIIETPHLSKQVNSVLDAKNISEKKQAAAWKNDAHFVKLPSNFGLPPYHFRCRTEVVPVWLKEDEIDGKKVEFASKRKDDIITHIDKTGVQRRLKNSNTHIQEKHKESKSKDIISALNSIKEIAPHASNHQRTVAKSANGFIMVFEADEIVTAFKPIDNNGKSSLDNYFKRYVKQDKKEIIKWKKENLILKYMRGLMTGL